MMNNNSIKLRFILLLFLVFCLTSVAVLGQNNKPIALNNEEINEPTKKIGFADFLMIYHSYSKTKLEDERLKKEGQEFQARIDADRDKITELEKKINSGILSEKEKDNLNKEMEELKTKVNQDIQEFKLKIENERKKTIDKIIEELRVKVSDYGKEKGYAMIVDRNELIFSDTNLDLTREMVEYVNKNNNQ